jgi:hypothetical protein
MGVAEDDECLASPFEAFRLMVRAHARLCA